MTCQACKGSGIISNFGVVTPCPACRPYDPKDTHFPDFHEHSLHTRVAALEAALAKQRAVNKELLEYLEHGYGLNDTIDALREALK